MHGKTLLGLVTVVALSLVVSFSLAGCTKKKPAGTQTPQLSKEASATDTSDVFKEFYSEDSAAKKQATTAAKQETFSTTSSSSSAEFSENGRYTVQVSCVRSQSFANSMASQLKDLGYPAYVAEVMNPTPSLSGTFYRVRIGGFDGVSGARSFGENTLIAAGYEYWVDKKSNDNVGMEGYGLGSGSEGSSAAGSYDYGGSTSSYQSQPSSGFGSTGSTESSYSTTPSSSSLESSTGSSSFESSSSPSTAPSTGTSSGTSDFGASTSTGSTSSGTGTSTETGSSSLGKDTTSGGW